MLTRIALLSAPKAFITRSLVFERSTIGSGYSSLARANPGKPAGLCISSFESPASSGHHFRMNVPSGSTFSLCVTGLKIRSTVPHPCP